MIRETLKDLIRRQPFESIEIRTTDGSSRWLRHPEFVILQENGLLFAEQGTDRFEAIPYRQVASVASFQTAAE